MALNQRYTHNDHIALTALANTESGSPVKIGQYVGVAQTTADTGDKVTIWLNGSYELTVSGALAEGQIVYINGSNGLTATASGNFPFGVANTAKGTGSGIAEVAPFGMITATAALA
ncbi:DUF2190 family protein [Zhihengliuella flava]|uniref:RecA/RadA family phage recombinase n=1 Tax=Zhihengliuella flava TaxID=1285193 RepID=A0A931GG05_9MICC|nr:DUF2190 family protein [Zhihengliuella flava]MBG6085820.1 putative RecA/RadA family phage recombinase [Zhihengliuella flava]